jgi:hypothetical protein
LHNEVRESVNYAPTLVVWVIDRTDSAQSVRTEACGALQTIAADVSLQGKTDAGPPQLLCAVVTYAAKVDELPEPVDAAAAREACVKIGRDESGREMTFTALKAAAEKYLPLRTQDRREVIFVLVTDEVGDDQAEEDAAIALCKKHIMPVYVVGVPAPFGRRNMGDMKTEARDGQPGMVFGPESREIEAVSIESLGGNYDLDVMDSGFGPFSLERLARETDGKFLAMRPSWREGAFFGVPGSEWPTSRARQFDPAVMKKYAPDYVSAAEYDALLKGNSACASLVAAGKLPRAEVRTQLNLTFTKRSEAQFKKDLDKAQQAAAKLEPDIEKIYDTLAGGEGDRAKLTSPRWQAAYDVALGRACAAKARIEGYNAMLAVLKNGKNFTRPESRLWRLELSDTTEAGGSIAKLVERSHTYLKRVKTEHLGTPWALIAERELQEQVGWKWVEE